VGADLHAGVDGAAVEPDARSTGGAVRGDRAGVGPEAVGGILGRDPALQRGAVDPDVVLTQPEVRQALPGRDPHLGLDEVDVGDLLGDGVLHLDPGVHLDEHVLAGALALGLDQELHGAGAGVVDGLGELHRVAAERLAQLVTDVRGGRDLDDLLVPPLDGAVALVQVQRRALGVGEDLHLDVPGPAHRLLDERSRVAERALGLAHGRGHQLAQLRRVVDPPHAPPATTRDGLDEDREADLLRPGQQLVEVGRRRGGLQRGDAGRPGRLQRAHLVAGELQHVGGRADERDARGVARPRQVGVLAQEAVAGVDGVGAGLAGRADDLVDVEIGADGVAALPDHVGLVGFDPVDRVAVLVGEDGDRLGSELVGGTEGADRDLTTVGDEDLGEHTRNIPAVCYRAETRPRVWAATPPRRAEPDSGAGSARRPQAAVRRSTLRRGCG
jgi:hypothetical protein